MRKALCMIGLVSVAALANAAGGRDMERPKVGLVLGGGGALGISHIGVLKVLEEERVPIDYIAGTSMGAIIGGLYASGMSPDEIQAFLQGLNWNDVMTDETPRRELYYRRKFEDQRYLVEVGIGLDGVKYGTGMAAGQKFDNLLQWQVQRAATVTNFNNLAVPYRAVATDLLAGKPYVLSHGNLARVMRASMAVPGAFTAVEIDGRLLVDGGIVDNLPVEVAREMGADIIIAVDVGAKSDKVDRKELSNIAGVLGRTYFVMRRPGQLRNFRKADIGIQPDLDDMMASEFARVAEFVPRGEQAARLHLEAIKKLAVDEETYAAYLQRHRRPMPGAIRLDAVEVSGQHRVNQKTIEGRIHSKPGNVLAPKTLNHDLMRIYGIGEFEQVLYQLDQQEADSGTLRYHVTEKAWGPNYLSIGFHLMSDFVEDTRWGLLANLTRHSINALGAEWRNELEIGSNKGALTEFYQPIDYGGWLFVAPMVSYYDEVQDVYQDEDHIAEYDVQTVMAKVDVGMQWKNIGELRIGPRVSDHRGTVQTGLPSLPTFDDNLVVLGGSFVIDQKDRAYFTRQGYYLATHGLATRKEWGSDLSFEKLFALGSVHHSMGNHTLEARFQYGTSFGSELPGYELFTLGGIYNFAGLARYQFRGESLGVASLGYQYRLMQLPAQVGRGIYALSRYDVGNTWFGSPDGDDLRHGFLLGVGVDSVLGPCYLAYGAASGGYHNIYFSIGNTF